MTVVIAGAHGKIGLALGGLLSAAGTEVRGIIRNPDHAADLEAAGVAPALCDLDLLGGPLAIADAVACVTPASAGAPDR